MSKGMKDAHNTWASKLGPIAIQGCKYLQIWCRAWPQQGHAWPCEAPQHMPCRHPGWWWSPQRAHSCAHTWGRAVAHAPVSDRLGTGPAPTCALVKAAQSEQSSTMQAHFSEPFRTACMQTHAICWTCKLHCRPRAQYILLTSCFPWVLGVSLKQDIVLCT